MECMKLTQSDFTTIFVALQLLENEKVLPKKALNQVFRTKENLDKLRKNQDLKNRVAKSNKERK